ncbi:MAG TPA: MDR family MFS transporter [Candidatus Limnocylindrales bacterium]|nr:MDR family MFS transporter [Candidatus Limnocylindrales bacterium]
MSATTAPTSFADRAPVELPHPVRLRILLAVMIGIFLAALDQTVVGTALPRIVTDLRGNDVYTWAFTAYLLTATISGPLYGKLSDLFGRRPIFLLGIAIFLVGSVLAGISPSIEWLIVARGIQGLGAGALFPIALAIIGDVFAPSERGKYQGLFGAVFGLSVLIGPAIGGLLTDTLGWQWVFFVNLPVGAVASYLVWRYLPSYHLGGDRPRIDYLGACLFAAALVPILIGLTNKQSAEWGDASVGGLLVLGAVFLVAFVFVESRVAEPIVPLGLFRIRSFTVSVAATFLAAFGFFAAVVFLPRWFQVVNGSSATESGYQILPLLGGLIISAVLSGQIVSRTGRYRWLIFGSLVLTAVGLFLLTTLHADTPIPVLWAFMFVTGVGVGPTFAVFVLVVQNSVPIARLGAATSGLTLFQQVGGTVGLAITGTLFASALSEQVPRQVAAAEVPPELAEVMAGGGLGAEQLTAVGDLGAAILSGIPEAARAQVEPFIPVLVSAIYEGFSLATASTFTVGIVGSLVAAGLVLLLREAPAPATQSAPAGVAARGASVHPSMGGREIPVPVEIEDDIFLPSGRH